MMTLVSLPEHERELRKKLKAFENLNITLIEKGTEFSGVGIIFEYQDIDELTAFLNEHFIKYQRKRLQGLYQGRIILVDTDDILWIESTQGETWGYGEKRRYLLDQRLYQLEESLYPQQFIRISKSCLVNLRYVEQIEPSFHGRLNLILKNNVQLEVSRSYASHFKQVLGVK